MNLRRLAITAAVLSALAFPLNAGALNLPGAVALSLPTPNAGLNQGYLPYQSCPSLGNCVLTGIYVDNKGYTQGVIESETRGTWGALKVVAPHGAVASKGVSIDGVACSSPGNCVVVGDYSTTTNQLPFAVVETKGVWRASTPLPLPANASASAETAAPHSIACVAVGTCTVVGTYTISTPSFATEGFLLDEVKGVWRTPVALTLPVGANVNPFVTLTQVACTSSSTCTAIGSYVDANNVSHALVVSRTAGIWRRALNLALPANASAFAGAQVNELACAPDANCVAAGTYNTLTGAVEPLVALSSAGVWNRAYEVNLVNPANNPESLFYGFKGAACASPGNCVVGGQYLDKNGHYQGFFANTVNGVLQRAQVLRLPTGGQQAGHNGGVVAVSCPVVGSCVAGAAYLNATGQYEATVVSESRNVWLPGTTVTLPRPATTVGVAGGIYALVCLSPTACQVSGSYQSSPTRYDGFTLVTGA